MAGLAAVTSRIKPVRDRVPTLCSAAGDRRGEWQSTIDSDLPREVRPQRHHRMAAAGIFANGDRGPATQYFSTAATHFAVRNTLRVMRELWETGVSAIS